MQDLIDDFVTHVVVDPSSKMFKTDCYFSNAGCLHKEIREWLFYEVGYGANSLEELLNVPKREWAVVFYRDTGNFVADRPYHYLYQYTRIPETIDFYFLDRNKAIEFKLMWA
jgi:hypothetical protein